MRLFECFTLHPVTDPRRGEGLDTRHSGRHGAWSRSRAPVKAPSFMRLFECFALHLVTVRRPREGLDMNRAAVKAQGRCRGNARARA